MTVAHTPYLTNIHSFTEIQMVKGYGAVQNKYPKKKNFHKP